jgi:hypothetical protein
MRARARDLAAFFLSGLAGFVSVALVVTNWRFLVGRVEDTQVDLLIALQNWQGLGVLTVGDVSASLMLWALVFVLIFSPVIRPLVRFLTGDA